MPETMRYTRETTGRLPSQAGCCGSSQSWAGLLGQWDLIRWGWTHRKGSAIWGVAGGPQDQVSKELSGEFQVKQIPDKT